MDPAKVKAALDALINGDTEACASILKDMIAAAAGGGAEPAADPAASSTLAEPAEPAADPAAEEQAAALAALTKRLAKYDTEIATLRASLAEREAADAVTELAERRTLIAELVKLRVEDPSTAWTGDAANREPCKRLALEPIEDMRARVATLRKGRPALRDLEAPIVTTLTADEEAQAAKMTPEQRKRFETLRASRRK
jgi:hypothetical protein